MAIASDITQEVRSDEAAVGHLLASTGFLGLGAILYWLSLLALRFPDFLTGPFSYGRLRPTALIAVMLGFLTLSLVGGVYYVLPRLTGAALWRSELAERAGWAAAVLFLIGMAVVALGWGDGVGPFALPWWLDLPVLAVLAVPAVVTVQTVRRREEDNVYVTLWFVLAATAWLPLLYLVTNLPGLASLGVALQEVSFVAGFSQLVVPALGAGLVYFVIPRVTGNPLAGRQLARVGFWSLAFAAAWSGPLQLVMGPTPDWLDAVAALFTLALPVSALANAVAFSLTLEGSWREVAERPSLLTAVAGAGFAVVLTAATAIAGFRSTAILVGLTPFWDGILYGMLFGVGLLWAASWSYLGIPAMTGRTVRSTAPSRRAVQLTVWGVGGTVLALVLAGVTAGYSWTGAAYTGAFVPAGDGWREASGIPNLFLGLAVLTGLVALGGQLSYALDVVRTVTAGRPAPQEVLVAREAADE